MPRSALFVRQNVVSFKKLIAKNWSIHIRSMLWKNDKILSKELPLLFFLDFFSLKSWYLWKEDRNICLKVFSILKPHTSVCFCGWLNDGWWLLLLFGTRAYLLLPDEQSWHIFFDPKQRLRVSCILWYYLSKWFSTILQLVTSFWCQFVVLHFRFSYWLNDTEVGT